MNIDREEIQNTSQIVIWSDIEHTGNGQVFTKHGVIMQSSVQ